VKRHTAPRVSNGKTLRLHLFFDVASCKLFADGGEVVMTEIFFPSEDFSSLKLYGKDGTVKVKRAAFFEVKSAFHQ
jgi:fructan beta-fructosidase